MNADLWSYLLLSSSSAKLSEKSMVCFQISHIGTEARRIFKRASASLWLNFSDRFLKTGGKTISISTTIKTIQDIMRKDAGVDGDAQRISQLGWMIFLKIFDDREKEYE